nr:Gamma-tubulin complex component 3 [Polyrhizophydium stewartii]
MKLTTLFLSPKTASTANLAQRQPPSDEYIQRVFQYCMRILGSRISPTIVSDEAHVTALMQKQGEGAVFSAYYTPKHVEDALKNTLTETDIIHDVLFVFQGVDGKHIKFDDESDFFVLDPSLTVPKPTRELVRHLCEVGWLYRKINQQLKTAIQSPSLGLYEQSFYSTIQSELVDYYRLVAMIENQLETNELSSVSFFAQGVTLRRLFVWVQGPLKRLRNLSVLSESCKSHKGGALISMVHNYVSHGDPGVHDYIRKLLLEISRPFYRMLQRWIYEGELEDPFGEFFVTIDPSADDSNLWRSKYLLNYEMVPAFISKPLAKKVFLIGKSLNFVRHTCNDSTYAATWSKQPTDVQYGDLKKLEFSIDSAYQTSSAHLLSVLFEKYRLAEHLQALKRYVLLGQGDFVQYLMDSLGPSLSKPASTIYRHNLTGTLESAIRSSNAQYDNPDILKRLDVRLLEASGGDTGWDIFALDYHVDSPINTILTPQAMITYLKLFTFLWRLKRVEHALSSGWRKQTKGSKSLRSVPGFTQEIQQCFVLRSEMVHFVNQLQHYILFEVIECSWDELSEFIRKKTGDLDVLIAAHNKYLNAIALKGLLAVTSAKNPIAVKLFKIFDVILAFDQVQESVFRLAADEQRFLSEQSSSKYQSDLESQFGVLGKASQDAMRAARPSAARVDGVRGQLQDAVDMFHVGLACMLPCRMHGHALPC